MIPGEPLPLGELELQVANGFGGSVIQVVGSLVFGTAGEFRQLVEQLLEQEPARLILDLRQASFIDSSGLGALVATRRLASEAGVELVLWGLTPQVRRVFEMVHAVELFRILDSPDSA